MAANIENCDKIDSKQEFNDQIDAKSDENGTKKIFYKFGNKSEKAPNYAYLLQTDIPKFESILHIPPRPASAYGRFYNASVAKIRKENPQAPLAELTRIAKKTWDGLNIMEKDIYYQKNIKHVEIDHTDEILSSVIKRLKVDENSWNPMKMNDANTVENSYTPEDFNQVEDSRQTRGSADDKPIEDGKSANNSAATTDTSGSTEETDLNKSKNKAPALNSRRCQTS